MGEGYGYNFLYLDCDGLDVDVPLAELGRVIANLDNARQVELLYYIFLECQTWEEDLIKYVQQRY